MKYFTTKEAALEIGLSERTITHYINTGKLNAIRGGNRKGFMIPASEVERLQNMVDKSAKIKIEITGYFPAISVASAIKTAFKEDWGFSSLDEAKIQVEKLIDSGCLAGVAKKTSNMDKEYFVSKDAFTRFIGVGTGSLHPIQSIYSSEIIIKDIKDTIERINELYRAEILSPVLGTDGNAHMTHVEIHTAQYIMARIFNQNTEAIPNNLEERKKRFVDVFKIISIAEESKFIKIRHLRQALHWKYQDFNQTMDEMCDSHIIQVRSCDVKGQWDYNAADWLYGYPTEDFSAMRVSACLSQD